MRKSALLYTSHLLCVTQVSQAKIITWRAIMEPNLVGRLAQKLIEPMDCDKALALYGELYSRAAVEKDEAKFAVYKVTVDTLYSKYAKLCELEATKPQRLPCGWAKILVHNLNAIIKNTKELATKADNSMHKSSLIEVKKSAEWNREKLLRVYGAYCDIQEDFMLPKINI